MLPLPDSRREDREEGRRGVVGREIGLRVADVDRFVLLPAWGVVEEDIAMFWWSCCASVVNDFVDLQRSFSHHANTRPPCSARIGSIVPAILGFSAQI